MNRITLPTSLTATDSEASSPGSDPSSVLSPPSSASPVSQTHASRFRIPGDVIAKVCEPLPDDQRATLKWAAGYCRERNLTCEEFGSFLLQANGKPYSGDSVYQVMTGRRDLGSVVNLCSAIDVLRRRAEEVNARISTFLETALTRKIWATCRRAFERKKLTFIFGPSQVGKTTALSAYAEAHNHGETIMVRMPSKGLFGDFINELAFRVGIPSSQRAVDLRRRIIESFDARTLLVIDEAHQCMPPLSGERNLACLEFVREIYDRRRCGVVICGTNVARDTIKTNRVLRQLWLRRFQPLQIPADPGKESLAKFAQAFGLPPIPNEDIRVNRTYTDDDGQDRVESITANPTDIQTKIIADDGLGLWISILEDAHQTAKEKSARNTWGRVIIAWRAQTA